MVLVVGYCSLGAGPWRCNVLRSLDAGFDRVAGYVAGYAAGYAAGAGAGTGSGRPAIPDADGDAGPRGDAGRLPVPAPPSPPPPVPSPVKTAAPPAAPPIAPAPRREELTAREPHAPAKPPATPRALVPDEVVMTVVRAMQPTFVACWKRAQRADPTLVSARVRISLEIDDTGAVTASRTDAEDPKLSRCLAGVARKLAFPALGRPAALEIPLYF